MTPDINTIEERFIETSDGHSLYTQLWGSKKDNASVFISLHGGPGSGSSDSNKDLYDPENDKVLFFDQRGCGLSKPYGSLDNNTTEHLINDINLVSKAHNLSKFTLVGGSWGSTLALAYALEHPDNVNSLVIRGVFTGSREEINFLESGGFKSFYPEVWENFVNSVPEEYKNDPAKYHINSVLGNDPEQAKKSAYEYSKMEYSVIGLDDRRVPEKYEDFDLVNSKIEMYYMKNLCFMEDEYILNNADKLTMPVWIVQGRYDAVCPPINAYRLHKKLPNSRLIWTTAGHSGNDRANRDAIKTIIMGL